MSDPRIALVVEGDTDFIVIEAALKAVLRRPFVLTQLQPERTRPEMGGGWGGVFKWCQQFRLRGAPDIETDPALSLFDLVIVHLDADVAGKQYADCGPAVEQAAVGLRALPCEAQCPPPANTVAALEAVMLSWLGIAAVGPKTLFCIPSKASEAWLAAAVLPVGHPLLTRLECNLELEMALSQLPKGQRVRKSVRDYRSHAESITKQWQQVKNCCAQANVIEQRIRLVEQAFPA